MTYRASHIKRSRRTKADIEAIRAAIIDILGDDSPQGVRQIFYALETRGLIEKTEAHAGKPTCIYQFGDHDPTGCLIPKKIEEHLDRFIEQHVRTALCRIRQPIIERVALTEEQIERYRLPTRPTKRNGNPHAKDFEGDSVELDALPARTLRDLVRECIERHISPDYLSTLRAAEESERDILAKFGRKLAGKKR